MNTAKDELLLQLADYTGTIHLALEGKNVRPDHSMIYLGHLAMCARIFKSVYLGEPVNEVLRFVRIEQSAFKFGTPSTERGALTKEAWGIFEPFVLSYLANAIDA